MGKTNRRRKITAPPVAIEEKVVTELKYNFCNDNPGAPYCAVVGASFAKADLLKLKGELSNELATTTFMAKQAHLSSRIAAIDSAIRNIRFQLKSNKLDNEECAQCGWGKGEASFTQKDLLCCGFCHQTCYCCRNCQVKHWKAEHKATCPRKVMPVGSILITGPPMDNLALALGGYHKMLRIPWEVGKLEIQELEQYITGEDFPFTRQLLDMIYGRSGTPGWPGPRPDLFYDFDERPVLVTIRFG